ncbi:hypothetical protein [Agrobacterium pusense]|uniref:hypothetical protein n=1 Tax=Agrobacterium pusense TaxID=648995 RepID=UPI000D33CCA2|nr:hypothetical protein [Agrobacterium pusense]PTV72167.1 hypothetical protein DBL06_21675 [Agrobacterium pusense]
MAASDRAAVKASNQLAITKPIMPEGETTMRKTANNDFEKLAPVEHEALPALSCMQQKTKRGVMSRHHP